MRVAYQHGAPYSYGLTLHNDSRWAVRLETVQHLDGSLLGAGRVEIDTTPFAGRDDTVPFRAVTLDPGADLFVRVNTRFANCESYEPNSTSGVDGVLVRRRALWATRTEVVEFPVTLSVEAPQRSGCPARPA